MQRRYAEIKNGKVQAVGMSEIAPNHGSNLGVVDITDMPEVVQGSLYDGTDFSPPPPEPTIVPKRRTNVSKDEFIRQFTFDEWYDIKNSNDLEIKKFVASLETYPGKFDIQGDKATAVLSKIAQAPDINIDQARSQEIGKGPLKIR